MVATDRRWGPSDTLRHLYNGISGWKALSFLKPRSKTVRCKDATSIWGDLIPFMEDLWNSDKTNGLSPTSRRISSTKADHLETIPLPGPNLTLSHNSFMMNPLLLGIQKPNCFVNSTIPWVLKLTLSHARLGEETSTKSAKVSRILEEASREVFGSVTSRSDSQSLKASVPINVTELGIWRRSSRVPEAK